NTMIRLSHAGQPIRVVDDQICAPTWAQAIADATLAVIDANALRGGVFHMTAAGRASWYDFAKAIFELTGRDVPCEPITTSEYPTPARRPS
ncbi:sugar nucleotide-binding protein, partial [Pseudomonas sp. FW305-122]|uniref:sugar nucleotide-binding protein n=1 Tax=Pseudomonas sp. FW305-122 TaxID=2070561 RepID=UPI0011AFCD9E